MAEEQERCSLCPEKITTTAAMTWICCDLCETWYHVRCLGMSPEEFDVIDRYHCRSCAPRAGPSTLLRKSSRKQGKINYADLVNGVVSHQSKWRVLLESNQFLQDKFERIERSEDLTLEYLRKTGFKAPIIVPAKPTSPHQSSSSDQRGLDADTSSSSLRGLDMMMPPNSMTVDDVRDAVGPETLVEVMDVATQSELLDWNMRDWADYFKTEPKERVYNVISLEISGTSLADRIQRPKIVRELDWIENFWPKDLAPTEFPKVQLYCLMSVFYHILSGAKTFYFVEPTSSHLRKYAKWSSSADQSTTFFGDEVAGKCYKVELQQGDTMFIPAGWIHAVHTPFSSMVIGGNFIHSLHVPMQYRVAAIEVETNVPPKFRFPFFEKLNWFVALGCHERGQTYLSGLSDTELYGIMSITMHLYIRQQSLASSSKTISRKSSKPISKEERHLIRASVPVQATSFNQGGPLGLLRLLNSKVRLILEDRAKRRAEQGLDMESSTILSPSTLQKMTLPTTEEEKASGIKRESYDDRGESDHDVSTSESTGGVLTSAPRLKLKLKLKAKTGSATLASQLSSGEEDGNQSPDEQQVPGSSLQKDIPVSVKKETTDVATPKLRIKLSTLSGKGAAASKESEPTSKRARKVSAKRAATLMTEEYGDSSALEDEAIDSREATSDEEWNEFESQLEDDIDGPEEDDHELDDGELELGSSDSEYDGTHSRRAARTRTSGSNGGPRSRKRSGSFSSRGSSTTLAGQELPLSTRAKRPSETVVFDEESGSDSTLDQNGLDQDTYEGDVIKKQRVAPDLPGQNEIRSLGGLAASGPARYGSTTVVASSGKKKAPRSTAKDRIKSLLMKRR
ncbi:JmjC domain-containing histone demethylation protein 1 [Gryganskiella cystojenkinii]|nr:JmjC domain-containing histone demethylation protein 1 [Gryganskiella cystojenkinii]